MLCAALAIVTLGPSTAAAQARAVRHKSVALASERIFSILLPPGYAESDKRYPVVYLFHGGGQDHTAFMARAMFPALARKQEAIFVMPAMRYAAMPSSENGTPASPAASPPPPLPHIPEPKIGMSIRPLHPVRIRRVSPEFLRARAGAHGRE